jgi:hypothetical protein
LDTDPRPLRTRIAALRAAIPAALVAQALLARPPLAFAETPEDRASARVLGTEGVRLADAGDCTAAIPKFEAAEQLFHAPTTLERLGECQVKLGRLVAGTENLNRVVREMLPPNAPVPFVEAQKSAEQLLLAALPRIGKLRIHVAGAPPERVTVTVDGANVPPALFDADRPTDPGTHQVVAVAPGYKATVATVAVAEGATQAVPLTLEVDSSAANAGALPPPGLPSAGSSAPLPAASARPSSTGSSSRTLAFVGLGVGVVGMTVGAVVGAMALGTKSTLDGECPNKVCPASARDEKDTLATRAILADVGFGVGIAAATTGLVLLLTSHGGGDAEHAARIGPWLAVGASGLGGTFE